MDLNIIPVALSVAQRTDLIVAKDYALFVMRKQEKNIKQIGGIKNNSSDPTKELLHNLLVVKK